MKWRRNKDGAIHGWFSLPTAVALLILQWELDGRRKQCLTHWTTMTNSWPPHILMETAATAWLGTNSELCVSVSLMGPKGQKTFTVKV